MHSLVPLDVPQHTEKQVGPSCTIFSMEEYERHKFREVPLENKLHVISLSQESRNKVSIGFLPQPERRFPLQKCNLKGVEGNSLSKILPDGEGLVWSICSGVLELE